MLENSTFDRRPAGSGTVLRGVNPLLLRAILHDLRADPRLSLELYRRALWATTRSN